MFWTREKILATNLQSKDFLSVVRSTGFSLLQSLLVLIYLIKNGSEKVVTSAREHLYDLKSLETFAYTDEQGKDQGINGNVAFFSSLGVKSTVLFQFVIK